MKTSPLEDIQTDSFELSTRLSFGHVFQSTPYWHGVGYGYIPQLVRELRSSQHKKSYLLSFGQRLLVLSVTVGSESFIDERRQQVNPIIEQVNKAGIGPRLVYCSPEKGFVVSEYIEGRCWEPNDFLPAGNIERVAQTLKKLHALPAEGPSFCASKLEQRYWSEISDKQVAVPFGLHTLQIQMQRVILHVQKNYPDQAVCHNNLYASNVLETGQKLRFVGWETASINDPYYDLAVIAHHHEFDDVQIDQLLFHYAGGVSDEQREHFYYSYAIFIYLDLLSCLIANEERQSVDKIRKIDMHIETLHSVLARLGV